MNADLYFKKNNNGVLTLTVLKLLLCVMKE
jgi:hypothetical protein